MWETKMQKHVTTYNREIQQLDNKKPLIYVIGRHYAQVADGRPHRGMADVIAIVADGMAT